MADMNDLLNLMARLRDPQSGCPWDLEQNFSTIAPYTLEEACEVVEAITRKDFDNLREELGDLLFQVVFHARMAEEQDRFDFNTVVSELVEKLVRRHPHVFPEGTLAEPVQANNRISPEEVKKRWQDIKVKEKEKATHKKGPVSALPDSLPATLPALKKAEKIQQAAARAGFDWEDASGAEAKIREELDEITEARAHHGKEQVEEEVGDLFFACVNYARHLGVDPEMALRKAILKFDGRFRTMESKMSDDKKDFSDLSLAAMEEYWQKAKLDF